MTKVEELEKEIERLSPEELAEIRDWVLEHDWRQWDQQIARDAASGKLEKLFRKSREDHEAGKSKEIRSISPARTFGNFFSLAVYNKIIS